MPELARELRRALDELGALVEDANKHACVVEDAFGLDAPVADFERLGEAEQAKARTELPGAPEALAELGPDTQATVGPWPGRAGAWPGRCARGRESLS